MVISFNLIYEFIGLYVNFYSLNKNLKAVRSGTGSVCIARHLKFLSSLVTF